MTPAVKTEWQESHDRFVTAWTHFARAMGRPVIEHDPGTIAVFAGVAIPFFNLVFLLEPVSDEADLEYRIRDGLDFGAAQKLPWMFCVCDESVPAGLRARRDELMAAGGLMPAMPLTGMIADSLTPPHRTPSVEFRPARDAATRQDISDINAQAYGMPVELARGIMDREGIFAPPACGVAAYRHGAPVACAATIPLDGCLYVAYVATLADSRRQGFAEACMRRSLEVVADATGFTRTVLHATAAGRPVYEKMGYRPVAEYTFFAAH